MDTADLAAKVRIPKPQSQEVAGLLEVRWIRAAAWFVLDSIERSAFVLLNNGQAITRSDH